ncbi:MAG TPA: sigma-70 family RNA polymerase sigma factor [Gemmatimonadaceae bacterium]|jgi:RNA polymerase sigma-70 factor (ECF subfamily)
MTSPSRPEDRPAVDGVVPMAVNERISDQEFETLLVGMLDGSYRLAMRLTGDSQDAEDLIQEAALRAFRFRHTFQRGTSFKAWFYRIVVNHFYTTTRRKRGTATSLDDLTEATDIFLYLRSAEAGLLRPDADPASSVVARMAEDDVARALASLPDEFRTVCTLYFMDDLSYQEIADILEVPIGTVRSRLHRGRHMLQKQLWRVAEELGIVPSPARGDS